MTLTVKTHSGSSYSNELMPFCESHCCSTPMGGVKGISVISASVRSRIIPPQVWTHSVWKAAWSLTFHWGDQLLSSHPWSRMFVVTPPSLPRASESDHLPPPEKPAVNSVWIKSNLWHFGLRTKKLRRRFKLVHSVRVCEFWQLWHPPGRRADTLSPTARWKDNLSRAKDKM